MWEESVICTYRSYPMTYMYIVFSAFHLDIRSALATSRYDDFGKGSGLVYLSSLLESDVLNIIPKR